MERRVEDADNIVSVILRLVLRITGLGREDGSAGGAAAKARARAAQPAGAQSKALERAVLEVHAWH
jgi:hypothetical protein